ncbi:hypothetical protein EJB05_23853, partial [Eragrostis curvula]
MSSVPRPGVRPWWKKLKRTVGRRLRSGSLSAEDALRLCEEIARRRAAHLLKYLNAKIISLGIGDTTGPIPNVPWQREHIFCGQLMDTVVMELNKLQKLRVIEGAIKGRPDPRRRRPAEHSGKDERDTDWAATGTRRPVLLMTNNAENEDEECDD